LLTEFHLHVDFLVFIGYLTICATAVFSFLLGRLAIFVIAAVISGTGLLSGVVQIVHNVAFTKLTLDTFQ